jgi:MYXO-CTERM domain-containing protein
VSGSTVYAGTIGGLGIAALPTAVPGAGVAGLATIGLVGSRRRRR